MSDELESNIPPSTPPEGEDGDEAGTTLPPVGVTVSEPPKPKKGKAAKDAPAVPTVKRIRIILEENDNIPPTGQFFGVNGKGSIIRPGEEVDVPVELIEVLNNAEMSVPLVDPNTNQVVGYRKKLRFPYRVIAKDA